MGTSTRTRPPHTPVPLAKAALEPARRRVSLDERQAAQTLKAARFTLAEFAQRGHEPALIGQSLHGLVPAGFIYRLTNTLTDPPQVYVGLANTRDNGEAGYLSRRMFEHAQGVRSALAGGDSQHVHRRFAASLQGKTDFSGIQVQVLDVCWEKESVLARLQLALMEMYHIARQRAFMARSAAHEGLNRTPGGDGLQNYSAESRIRGALSASRTVSAEGADRGLLAAYIIVLGQIDLDGTYADALRAVGVEVVGSRNKKPDSERMRLYDSKLADIKNGNSWGWVHGFVAGLSERERGELLFGLKVVLTGRKDKDWSLSNQALLEDPVVKAHPVLLRFVQTAHGVEHARYKKDIAAIEDFLALSQTRELGVPVSAEQWRTASAVERVHALTETLRNSLAETLRKTLKARPDALTPAGTGWFVAARHPGERTVSSAELSLVLGRPVAGMTRDEMNCQLRKVLRMSSRTRASNARA